MLNRIIAHIDCDSFYAQVEHQRLNIPYTQPLGVLQWNNLIAVNYAAKAFGVRRGMSSQEAKTLCPNIIFAKVELIQQSEKSGLQEGPANSGVKKVSLRRYRVASFKVMSIIRSYVEDKYVQRTSLDEVYLDLTSATGDIIRQARNGDGKTNSEKLDDLCKRASSKSKVLGNESSSLDFKNGDHVALAAGALVCEQIRNTCQRILGFTLSAGIAKNKLVAKLASARNKPNLQTVVTYEAGVQMVRELPLLEIPGYGRKLGMKVARVVADQLKQLYGGAGLRKPIRSKKIGVRVSVPSVTLGDLELVDVNVLRREFGEKIVNQLLEAMSGNDQTRVRPAMAPKSLNSIKSVGTLYEEEKVVEWLELLTTELIGRVEDDREMFRREPTMLSLQIRRPAVPYSGNSAKDISRRIPLPGPPPALLPSSKGAPKVETTENYVKKIVEMCIAVLKSREVGGIVPCSRIGIQFDKFKPVKAAQEGLVNNIGIEAFFAKHSDTSGQSIEDVDETLSSGRGVDPSLTGLLDGYSNSTNVEATRSRTSSNVDKTDHSNSGLVKGVLDSTPLAEEEEADSTNNSKCTVPANGIVRKPMATEIVSTSHKQESGITSIGTVQAEGTRNHETLGKNIFEQQGSTGATNGPSHEVALPICKEVTSTGLPQSKTEIIGNLSRIDPQCNESRSPSIGKRSKKGLEGTNDEKRKTVDILKGPPQSSREMGAEAFVNKFYKASRLHFIGTWKQRFDSILQKLPVLPPLPLPDAPCRVIFHVDMDAFFASVGILSHPELRNEPVAICWGTANQGNGEISSANYVARKFGIRSGMWAKRAYALCPALKTLPFEFEKYADIAEKMYNILFSVTLHVEGVSCDEAFLDITANVAQPGCSPRDLAERIRSQIYEQTKCTASVGCSSTRFLAKIATSKAKPNGYFELPPTEAPTFLSSLPVRELPGVGWSTCKRLAEQFNGAATCGELAKIRTPALQEVFGAKSGQHLADLARGIDRRPWNPRPSRQSIGAQISWGVRMANDEEVHDFLKKLAEQVESRMKDAVGVVAGKTVVTKIWRAVPSAPDHLRKGSLGHGVCDILTRSCTLDSPVCLASDIGRVACKVYDELKIKAEQVRGAGITVSSLVNGKAKAKAKGISLNARMKSLSKREAGPSSLYSSTKFDGYRAWQSKHLGNSVRKSSTPLQQPKNISRTVNGSLASKHSNNTAKSVVNESLAPKQPGNISRNKIESSTPKCPCTESNNAIESLKLSKDDSKNVVGSFTPKHTSSKTDSAIESLKLKHTECEPQSVNESPKQSNNETDLAIETMTRKRKGKFDTSRIPSKSPGFTDNSSFTDGIGSSAPLLKKARIEEISTGGTEKSQSLTNEPTIPVTPIDSSTTFKTLHAKRSAERFLSRGRSKFRLAKPMEDKGTSGPDTKELESSVAALPNVHAQMIFSILSTYCDASHCPRRQNQEISERGCVSCISKIEQKLEDCAIMLLLESSHHHSPTTLLEGAINWCSNWSESRLPKTHWLANMGLDKTWRQLVTQIQLERGHST